VRSGFVTLIGRPNVGKSTLVNRLVGQKVAIVSERPQTTRAAIRGVRTTEASQIVFVDTPGLHRPHTLLGERTNERARATLDEVDVVCVVVEANARYGPGDRFVSSLAHEVDTPAILVVNKTDAAASDAVLDHLAIAQTVYKPASIVGHGGRVRTLALGDDGHALPLTPELQLFHRGGAVGVAGREHHVLFLGFEALCQLAQGGGLAHAIHAQGQHHERLNIGGEGERFRHRHEQRHDLFDQCGTQCQGIRRSALAQVLDESLGGLYAHIPLDETGLQFLELCFVHRA